MFLKTSMLSRPIRASHILHTSCRCAPGCSRSIPSLHFSTPAGHGKRKKGVIRVSCLAIRENHGRRTGALQKKCLTAGEPERPCFVTRGVKEAIWQVRLRAPFSSARLAPRRDGPLTPFTSPCGEKCRLLEGHGSRLGPRKRRRPAADDPVCRDSLCRWCDVLPPAALDGAKQCVENAHVADRVLQWEFQRLSSANRQ